MRALELLNYLGALDDEGNLTEVGEQMSDFPLDPQLSKMLMAAKKFKCTSEILSIVAMLNVPSPFMRPPGDRKAADAAKSALDHQDGDHLTLLNVYHQYKSTDDPDWAYQNYINGRCLKSADNVRNQLERYLRKMDLISASVSFDDPEYYPNIAKALTAGSFMQVAYSEKSGKYRTIKDEQDVILHPSCCLTSKPQWVIYNEYVLTGKSYIRGCTKIKPEWLLRYAPDYFDLRNFPDGPAKRELTNIALKMSAKEKKKSRQN